MNFCGDELKTEVRRKFEIPDANMFVTNFVVYTLLESQRLGTIQVEQSVINNAIDAILTFKDQNSPKGSPIFTFWPQVYNESLGFYTEYPVNLNNLIRTFGSFSGYVDAIAEFFKAYNILNEMKSLADFMDISSVAFHIPPDADDTGTNLALGNMLNELSTQFPEALQNWNQVNTNLSAVIDAYLTYAYRPFSTDFNEQSIDPRTYYAIHPFLEQWKSSGRDQSSLVLPCTWFSKITQQERTFPYLQMPFNVNNLDLSVTVNSVFGIVSLLRQQLNQGKSIDANFFTEDLQNMVVSTSYLIEWAVNSEVVYDRSDLALLYYPSIYDFSWFISRLLYFLEDFNLQYGNNPATFPAPLQTSLQVLRGLMEGNGTQQLLNRVQYDTSSSYVYWIDFLGDADTFFGKPEKYGEDRFFSSALAINALIDTWTLPDSTSDYTLRKWKSNVPTQVLTLIESAVTYLNEYILTKDEYSYNAFFSGSMKSEDTYAYVYPSNVCMLLNGTTCDPHGWVEGLTLTAPMAGVVSPAVYDTLLTQLWANSTVPTTFTGYNPNTFPYWSSTPLTHSISLLALSKYLNLNNY
eukprot:gene10103-12392_t